jgi:hypothetical protein
MVLLAATTVVLNRWSGEADLTIGTVSSHRPLPETRALVGDFTNFMALRLQLSPDDTVRRCWPRRARRRSVGSRTGTFLSRLSSRPSASGARKR